MSCRLFLVRFSSIPQVVAAVLHPFSQRAIVSVGHGSWWGNGYYWKSFLLTVGAQQNPSRGVLHYCNKASLSKRTSGGTRILYKPYSLLPWPLDMGRRLRDDPDPLLRPAGGDRGGAAEAVKKLCHAGRLTEAVDALEVLVQTDPCVSKFLFFTVLKECVSQEDIVLGSRVHAFTVLKGYQSDTFLCNHILRMYATHGRLQNAIDVFDAVAKPDAYMWSSLISAHVKHGKDTQAVQLYHRMCRSSVKPDGHVFVAALQACARSADLKSGQQVHAHVLASGVEPDAFVCNCLVAMYAKCGSLEDARVVFDKLREKNVVTWTAMIAGYSQQGMGQEALRLYSRMQDEGITVPNSVTFMCLLNACASVGTLALEKGKNIHVQIKERGHQDDVFVASSLVDMYAKCGSLEDARKVFDGLRKKNVVTWNAMIAGYSKQGMGFEALCLYRAMQQEGVVVPDSVTFMCLLQACASVGTLALMEGKHLHKQIREGGHQADMSLANSLVHMYAKCGSFEDARRVFDELDQKNVLTWTAMIAGYSQRGMGKEALHLYYSMQDEGMGVPDSMTFVCLLQTCASLGAPALQKGKHLHAQITEGGHESDVSIASSLVNMYSKCGSLEAAQRVFDGLVQKSVVTWNALIAGYSQRGMGKEALRLYSCMQEEGIVVPDSVTFVCLLQACASAGTPALEQGRHIHEQIREQGHEADVFVASSLVNMYAKCGSLDDAQIVFDGLGQKDLVIWTAMIAGFSQQGMGQKALRVYSAMQEGGLDVPDPATFVCLLQACASVGTPALEKGQHLHAQIRERGHQADLFVASSLIDMYAKCGSLEEARRLFNELHEKNVVTWNAMIAAYSQQGMGQEALCLYSAMQQEGIFVADSVTFVCLLQACASMGTLGLEKGIHLHTQIRDQGRDADVLVVSSLLNMYAKCGSLADAQRVFDGLGEKDVVTWTVMIAGYSQQGMGQQALQLYRCMQEEGLAAPNSVTFVCLLQACANVAALYLGRQLHAQTLEQGLEADVLVAGSLINMYGKSGSTVDAQLVFDAFPERDVVAWNALVGGYSCQGDGEMVFELVHRMQEDGIQPDGITLLSVLTACSHLGLVKKGWEYFEAMTGNHSIVPTDAHYTCMVDLLGRAGQLNDALAFVRTMPVLPNAAVWHTLLGACGKWSSVEVGRHAFHEAVNLDERDATAYVLMSNIYRSAGMWKQAQNIQERRTRMRAWKQPGQSWWADKDGVVHSFMVGHEKHIKSPGRLNAERMTRRVCVRYGIFRQPKYVMKIKSFVHAAS